jgi:DNA modification methylase
MAKHRITQADIKDWAKNYKGELFDGILCDPPYELGFMGKSWDSSGIAFDVEMWADIFRHIKPGGHLLAFSGSRTYHRMAVAIEDAGFEIRDMIEWVYGSGFPKSLDVSKAIDKNLGVDDQREITHYKKQGPRSMFDGGKPRPASLPASLYKGYGTALKPAHEPCVLARKPIEGTVAQNVLKHGTGGLNIDGTRVETQDIRHSGGQSFSAGHIPKKENAVTYTGGRFPANLIHDGSDEVEAVFPQTGSGKFSKQTRQRKGFMLSGSEDNIQEANAPDNYGDSGSASRFFYTAKASKSERNKGLEGFEPKRESDRVRDDGVGGDNPRNRTNNAKANHHPTVKPLSLTKYLATLIKPPTGGRLLVPFSGSGSEMIGALQAGWGYVEGVELTEEYIPIAEARIKYWLEQVEEEDKQGKLL